MAYQTAAEIKAAVTALNSATYPDATIEGLVAEFEKVAEDYRGVAFEVRNTVETIVAHQDSPFISLRRPFIRALSSLTVDGTTIDSSSYVLNARLGVIRYAVARDAVIVATYTHGLGFRRVTDGATTNTSTTVTSATAAFTSDDVGETIVGTGIPGGARIVSVTNATTVVISAAATATATGLALRIAQNEILVRACRQYVRSCAMADNSNVPRDVIGQSFEGNYTRYSTPDKSAGRLTGYLEVDRLLNSLPDYRLGIA